MSHILLLYLGCKSHVMLSYM